MLFYFSGPVSVSGQSDTPNSDSLYQVLLRPAQDTIRVKTLNRLSMALRYDSTQKAIELAKEATILAKQLDFTLGEMESYYTRSILYLYQNDYDQAIHFNEKSQSIAIARQDSTLISSTYNNEGRIYRLKGDYPRAVQAYHRSLEIDRAAEDHSGVAIVANNIGVAYKELGDLNRAQKYFQLARQEAEKANSSSSLAMSLSNLGEIHSERNEDEQALAYFDQSLTIARELGISKGVVINSIKIGEVLYRQKRYRQAKKTFAEVLEVSRGVPDPLGITTSLNHLALIDLAQNQVTDALEKAQEAYALATDIQSPEKIADIALTLSDIYAQAGDAQQSLDYFKQYTTYQDSLFTLEKNQQIAKLETQYQTAQKEQRINELEQQQEVQQLRDRQRTQLLTLVGTALLILTVFTIYLIYQQAQKRRANRQLRVQKDTLALRNEQVQRALNDKELLIQEINHRAKNNLYTIESLLKAQLNQIQDTEAKALIQESQSRIHSISLLHQQLFTGDLPDSVNMQSYLGVMLDSYFDTNSRVTVRKDIDHVVIDSTRAVALGLIVNELVTNSIKHAFAVTPEGRLSVSFQQKDSLLQLEVEDYSEPSEADPASQPPSTFFGLELVRGLTEQLRGTMDVIRQSGFLVRITIPY